MQIIGLVGWQGNGKDTAADYFCQKYNFKRESFASSLKDTVSSVFNWDRELLEGRSSDSREWRETIDKWWATRLGIPHLTPRWVLQYWGTELCRDNFHQDIWIGSLENRLLNTGSNIVITDCRFPNELHILKKLNAKLVWIIRGGLPEWYETAVNAAKGDSSSIDDMKTFKIHESEWGWLSTNFNFIIHNNGTIEEYYKKLDLVI